MANSWADNAEVLQQLDILSKEGMKSVNPLIHHFPGETTFEVVQEGIIKAKKTQLKQLRQLNRKGMPVKNLIHHSFFDELKVKKPEFVSPVAPKKKKIPPFQMNMVRLLTSRVSITPSRKPSPTILILSVLDLLLKKPGIKPNN